MSITAKQLIVGIAAGAVSDAHGWTLEAFEMEGTLRLHTPNPEQQQKILDALVKHGFDAFEHHSRSEIVVAVGDVPAVLLVKHQPSGDIAAIPFASREDARGFARLALLDDLGAAPLITREEALSW